MDTSKTSSIKSLLLQAWRERWTDVRWGINIKNVLPRGVSGDVYDLADCILQEALVGPGPNNLFLSYLTHCLSAQVVSYGAVLSSIGRFQSFFKPPCILSLLQLLYSIQAKITCHGNEEECIALCKAIVGVTHWLYLCMCHSIGKIVELKQSTEHGLILEKACESLSFFSESTFLKALLYIGKHEEPTVYSQLVQKQQELETKLSQSQSFSIPKDTLEGALNLVRLVDDMPKISLSSCVSGRVPKQPLVCSLNANVAIEAVLNPASDIQGTVDHLLLMKKLLNLSSAELYCEIIRAGFMGLANGSNEDLKWAAFTFLKVPQLLLKIHSARKDDRQWEEELEAGLMQLLNYSPLLDLTDSKCHCDCLQYLLNELQKAELLTETQAKALMHRRQTNTQKQNLQRPDQQTPQAGATLILRAEPTVTSILKTLDSDYSKNQEGLLGILCHIISGKSFELILSAAAATGKLSSFVKKLIKFNEYNKQSSGEATKNAQTRALLFDITFLMLCHIAQHYGIHSMTFSEETRDSFFAAWVPECLAEGGRYNCPDKMLAGCDPAKVDLLLEQFMSNSPDFKSNQAKWHEVCVNVPMAIKEILIAWEHGAISTDTVKMILDNVKSRMCCLPVCISAWLCSYITVLHHEERLKPMNMLQQFMTPLASDTVVSTEPGGERSGAQEQSLQQNPSYKERSTLMANIIKKMMYDLHPPQHIQVISHSLTAKTPLWEVMDQVFSVAHSRGWIDWRAIHSLDTLMCVGGPQWFSDTLVRQALKHDHLEDLHRAIDLSFGLFHVDIEQCALALLTQVLPNYLLWETRQDFLTEPRGSALARLVVLSTFAALQARTNSPTLGMQRGGRKRPYWDMELEEAMDESKRMRPSKIRRGLNDSELLDDTPFALQCHSEENYRSLDPLSKAVADTMRLLMAIASDSVISQRSVFPLLLFEQVVLCAGEEAHRVLQFAPLGLVPQLVRSMPLLMSHQLILALSSLQTSRARKVTARATCQLQIARSLNTTHLT
ncbi:hypothetical protein HPB49_019636 [Dermacentor silvarum]|uniref:Uncharacterized protein n=1 Tax=Dermacentor silvarum TaxID=543639 RepID=A0ACB8CAW9_DERSI|nr:mediator of RNA polymerase II transcription subunit 24 [Dermacentor silvarum]KAH7938066.1 hypothetical protein HPB49_019636 [Dermacentor silvarum]